MGRTGRMVAGLTAVGVAALAVLVFWLVTGPVPSGLTSRVADMSASVVDRQERLLRAYTAQDGRWRLVADIEALDPRLIDMLVAYEDRRFWSHHGVDPLALLRAGGQALRHQRIVSGGSTLTMQLARLIEPRPARTLTAKLIEMRHALALERRFTKPEILALYLTLAPYGGNIEGVRAASLAYFGKEPRRLTLGETALLVALPQAPEARRPDRQPQAARAGRDRVLARLDAQGVLPSDQVAQALREASPTQRQPMPALAPHLADRVLRAASAAASVATTLEAPVQAALERLAADRATAFGPDVSIAILAVEHASGAVVAEIASAGFHDATRQGQVDMVRAVRSPGSTLKPFIYALGFEDGLIHPETLIDDRPMRFGTYAPVNFDLTFQGTVPIAKALQLSLNVPAVAVLDAVGPARLGARLREAGGGLVLPPGEAPGLAMGLGGVGVRLFDLVTWYAALARGGTAVELFETPRETPSPEHRFVEPVAAWYTAQTLLGTPPPHHAPGRRIAFKTGTSYGYRDAWSVGFDGRYVIGVWVGRPDGAPVPGLVGRQAAAPILFDAFARTGRPLQPLAAPPRGVLVTAAARLPLALQRFRDPGRLVPLPGEVQPLRILFPPDGAQLALDPADGAGMPVKLIGGAAPFTVFVNGIAMVGAGQRRTLSYRPDGPGFVRLTVVDAAGRNDSVRVRLQTAP
jgi:penicillin-binding protein 1C